MSVENKPEGRVFTEGEAYALVADNVARETAEFKAQVDTLQTEKSDLQTKLDVLETEKAAAEQRAEKAEQDLATYKAEVEQEKAQEARKAERLAEVAKANPVLDLSSETDAGRERQGRIAAMSDEAYAAYLADMREVASKSEPKGEDKGGDQGGTPPRNTAAFSADSGEKSTATPVMGLFGARRALDA